MFLLERVAGGSGVLVTGFLAVGMLFMALAIGWFLFAKQGLRVRNLEPAERFWYSREAAVLLAELAPLIMALKDREKSLELELNVDATRLWEVQEAAGGVESRELWSAFARASASVEEDPRRAVEQLRWLLPRLRERVTSLDELLDRGLVSGTLVERGERDGRA